MVKGHARKATREESREEQGRGQGRPPAGRDPWSDRRVRARGSRQESERHSERREEGGRGRVGEKERARGEGRCR
eukprot:1106231-Rhodomonas_salina.2